MLRRITDCLVIVFVTMSPLVAFGSGGPAGPAEGDVVIRGAVGGHAPRVADVELEVQGDYLGSSVDEVRAGAGVSVDAEVLLSSYFSFGVRLQFQSWNSEDNDDAGVSSSLMAYFDAVMRGRFPIAASGTAFVISIPLGLTAFVPSEDLSDAGWDPGGGVNAGAYVGIDQVLAGSVGIFGELGVHGNVFTTAYTGFATGSETVDFTYAEFMLAGQLGLFVYF